MRLGLIGAGIQKSRSPALHEGEAKEQVLSLSYELIDLDKLGVGMDAPPRYHARREDQERATFPPARTPAAAVLSNRAPPGMARRRGWPPDATLRAPRHWVAEIVYVPLETELLRVARAKGCRTVDGGG